MRFLLPLSRPLFLQSRLFLQGGFPLDALSDAMSAQKTSLVQHNTLSPSSPANPRRADQLESWCSRENCALVTNLHRWVYEIR